MTQTVSSKRNQAVFGVARSLCHLIAVATLTVWGFVFSALPLPGLLYGFGTLIVSVLLWALFLSPKPVLRADRFAQSMIELLLIAGAVAAMIEFGVPWIIAAIFGIAATAIGFVAGMPADRK